MAPVTEPVLNAAGLRLRFPGAATDTLEGFDLAVAAGEFIALVGGSGVGKSTLLRVVAGLLSPDDGTVTLNSPTIAGQRRRAIVFQDGRLLPWRRLRGNSGFVLEGLGLSAAERRARIDDVLRLTRLGDYADRYPNQLSGGQVQRAGIARALAVRPDLLLMDEPFSAVDAITRRALQDEMLRIWRDTGTAILFVTHDIQEAALLAERVVVLSGQPARIVLDHRIDIPHAERRNSADLAPLITRISEAL